MGSSENKKSANETSGLPLQDIDQILKPLSNPTRQQLLILLATGPVTYTDLLQHLEIESGSFYWHIGKMKVLVEQNELKEYFLSDLGRKAYELLVFDGTKPQEMIPFRPDWYIKGFSFAQRIYNLPGWILIQQLLIILFIASYLFSQESILQIGSLSIIIEDEVGFVRALVTILISVLMLATGVIISQWLYIQPDREHFKKSMGSLFLRVMISSSMILLSSITLSILVSLELVWLANNPIFQLILSMITLIVTIMSTTIMVDRFLDLGLKDGLLIVLPPYYALILISFYGVSLI